ncbi:response regulator [Komarekiella sp. 'clone 1']|uniref:histidine kinase n=1 Tax=Komarekiella delphini-convector SJRDD-AB1 TaxID=2593771 RepID=A0AA40SSI4_9NOST|nr:ATP-binding protein [Komarekiella delphini-convector]MBD6614441.1 response regulator [Komarekiella delphini-convector SJRDD-AB1]
MNIDDLSQQIEELRSRVVALLQRTTQEFTFTTSSQQDLITEAFEELHIALEELKVAEEQLKATRAVAKEERHRYQELFDFAPDGYLVTDIYGTILEANRAASVLLNVSQRFLIRKPLLSYIAQSDHQAFFDFLTQLQHLDRREEWEICLQPRKQVCFDAAVTVVTVRNNQREPVALRWLMRDISDRKRLELERNQLLASEQATRIAAQAAQKRSYFLSEASCVLASSLDYHTTLNSVAQLAVPTLADWCIVDVIENNLPIFSNPIVAALEAQKEALVRKLQQCYPVSIDADYGAPRVLSTGKPQLNIVIHESSLLKIAYNEEHLSLLYQLQAKSDMIVPLLVRDRKLGTITFASTQPGRHYTTVDLVMACELAQRAAIAIDNARLYQQAQEASRIKDEFLAIVSHELRTPLNSMIGWVQMIRNRKLDEATTSKALETIERNAKIQTKVIDDILDISRIVRGKIRLNSRKVNLIPIINGAIEALRPTAEIKNIQIEFNFDPSVGQVIGDAERLQQILWNLLSNAIKFTPSDGHVEVHLKQVNSNAQITVTDTGKGISAEFLPYIFERFSQADSTTTRANNGLGLGLAIVRYLVEMHSGRVYAVSEGEGRGATFTVQLPIVEPPPEQLINESEEQFNHFTGLDNLQVLLVEDNRDTRELIAFILEHSGAQVTAVSSVGEALEMLAKFRPDILLSDIGMPEEDGYSLIRKIRAQETGQKEKLPAIALTAFARDEERKLILQAGFQAHISKPVEPDELVTIVTNLAKPSG